MTTTEIRPTRGTVQVERVKGSGVTKGGLFVLWENESDDAMLVRVIAKGSETDEIRVGAVYVTKPFRDQRHAHPDRPGEFLYFMNASYLEAEMEGYDV